MLSLWISPAPVQSFQCRDGFYPCLLNHMSPPAGPGSDPAQASLVLCVCSLKHATFTAREEVSLTEHQKIKMTISIVYIIYSDSRWLHFIHSFRHWPRHFTSLKVKKYDFIQINNQTCCFSYSTLILPSEIKTIVKAIV